MQVFRRSYQKQNLSLMTGAYSPSLAELCDLRVSLICEFLYVSRSDPTHQRASGNLKYFEYQLVKQKKAEDKDEGEARAKTKKGRPDDYLPERKKYEQLCRGEGIRMVRTDRT